MQSLLTILDLFQGEIIIGSWWEASSRTKASKDIFSGMTMSEKLIIRMSNNAKPVSEAVAELIQFLLPERS